MDRKVFDRWERVKEKAEELRAPVERELRQLWKDYVALGLNTRGDWFPDSVDEINIYSGKVNISGTVSRRGCVDGESCSMPVDFVFGEDAGRQAAIARHEREKKEQADAAARQAERNERAQLAALKAKYGEN